MTVRCASASPAVNRGFGKTSSKVPVLVEPLNVTPIAGRRKSIASLHSTPADKNTQDKKIATPTRLKEDLLGKNSPSDSVKSKKGLEERAIKLWAVCSLLSTLIA